LSIITKLTIKFLLIVKSHKNNDKEIEPRRPDPDHVTRIQWQLIVTACSELIHGSV